MEEDEQIHQIYALRIRWTERDDTKMMFPGMGAGVPPNVEEQRLMTMLQEMQVTDSIRTFTELINRCFADCVHSFRSSTLDGKEVCNI